VLGFISLSIRQEGAYQLRRKRRRKAYKQAKVVIVSKLELQERDVYRQVSCVTMVQQLLNRDTSSEAVSQIKN